jgi:gluconolactonase
VNEWVEILASGIGHPEGPDILPDGRIVMVETYTGKIVAWSAELGLHDYVTCGGGPNACLLGSDGAVYITQNGGIVGPWRAKVMVTPSIQRAWPDGKVEVVIDEIEGLKFQAPNDLTFGPDGRLYFTDPGDFLPDLNGLGRIFAVNSDGTGELIDEIPNSFPNGITSLSDGTVIWMESYKGQVYRIPPGGRSELVAQLPEGHVPDGLKIDESGDLWITTFTGGGVDVIKPDGTFVKFVETGGIPLNCIFQGEYLLITDWGERPAVGAETMMEGRLSRIHVGVRGKPLYRGQVR